MISFLHKPHGHNQTIVSSLERGHDLILNCSYDDFHNGLCLYESGELIQDAFPFLSDDEREFLLTGTTPEEWREMCEWFDQNEEELH
jgi:hypothetical protein